MKRYITERNAREGVASSGSRDTEAPLTPVIEVPIGESAGASVQDAAQDGVDN